MNEYHQFLRTRRSIRRFTPDPVPATVMDRILSTATFAPSAHNLQPWRFARIQSADARTKLGVALTKKMKTDMQAENADPADSQKRSDISLRRIVEAPEIILLCRDKSIIRKEEPEEHHMGIQSTALIGLQLMLAAHAEGLGANWICWPLYAQQNVQDALDLSNNWMPQAMLFIGYAGEEPNITLRKTVNELLSTK